jgi:hypothetical protein
VSLFLSCLDENKFDMASMDGIIEGDFIYDDPGKYLLSHNQLESMFKGTMDFLQNKITPLSVEFEAFLINNACYRKIVYEIYQTINNKNANKTFIKVDPRDSILLANPKLLARYDEKSKTIIFRELDVTSLLGIQRINFVVLIHEMMHHWQHLLFGKSYLQYQYMRNVEFEVIFLLDVASIQYQHKYASIHDEENLMYLKHDPNSSVTYTQEEKEDYVNAINSTLIGRVGDIKDKLDSLAKNFKKYNFVNYTPWQEFRLINYLYRR